MSKYGLMSNQYCSICGACGLAVNYRRGNKTYYRNVCNSCDRKRRKKRLLEAQLLQRSGYKKRSQCDRCGFRSKVSSQMQIVYLDSNRYNTALANLRSYCLLCIEELKYMPSAKQNRMPADY